jgi:hypothetical protein
VQQIRRDDCEIREHGTRCTSEDKAEHDRSREGGAEEGSDFLKELRIKQTKRRAAHVLNLEEFDAFTTAKADTGWLHDHLLQ